GRAGDDVRLEAGRRGALRDRALRAEVDDGDTRAGSDGERLLRADLAVERPAVDRRLGERARVQLVDRRVAERAADDALVADPAHERARVDPCEGDDAALAQPACELRADVAHHDALALDAVGLHPRL